MKSKWIIASLTVLLVTIMAFVGLAQRDAAVAAQDVSSKLETTLLDRFTADGSADYIVHFTDQADLSAAAGMGWSPRGQYVVNALTAVADASQANAKAILDNAGLKYQTFIAGNELYVWSGTLTDANAIAALPEVEYVRATRTYSIDPVVVTKPFDTVGWAGDFLSKNLQTTVGSSPNATVDWGITDTKADQFWAAYGVKGDGIKVANIDTGVQWDHPALVNQFACPGDPGNANCWSDPENWCGGTACDNQGHGTHTMGTMVAKDDPSLQYIAGMAPNATWIACKGCGTNNCSDFALNSCADWILAPGGNADNRPNVVNNSWGGGGGDTWYLPKVQAWIAAGVFPAFSAGNNYTCSSMGSPGDYQESFASASHMSNRTISDFSSKGPSPFGDDPYTKPNISSPGSNICSSVPGNGWSCGYSGTSMASPHSAGAVALLWSCNPNLIGNIDGTFQLLQNNADAAPAGDCGAPPDGQGNYTYGYGYLDVLQAGLMTCGAVDFGSLDGYVTDQDGNPVEGANVSAIPGINDNQIQALTDPTGYYTMTIPIGTYNVTASKANFVSQTVTGVVVQTGLVTHQNFDLTFLGSWTQLPKDPSCPDYTRLDAEYFPGTGLAYILGGRGGTSGGDTFGNVWSYDPATNTCTDTGTVMPTPVSNYTIALVNNGSADLLCIFGGRDSAGGYTPNYQCYDPIANTASTIGTLPGDLPGFIPGGVAVLDNKVFVFGGFRNTVQPYHTAQTWEWDPVTDTWTQKGDQTIGRGYVDVGIVDGLIYGFGGDVYDGTNLVAQTIAEVFDPVAGTWNDAAVADLPSATAEGRGFGFDSTSGYDQAGKVIVAGGGVWPADTLEVFSYDVASNSYDYSFPDLNITRRNQAGFFLPGNPSGAMYVFGGRSSATGYGGDLPPYAPPELFPVNVTIPQPNIKVTWPSLNVVLAPDTTTTQLVTIKNIGTLPLDWLLSEVIPVDWLAETPTSGTLNPGESVDVTVTFDSTGLVPGVYDASLEIDSNDPDTPSIIKPVTLTVKPLADLAIVKTDTPDPVFALHPLTYTLSVSNLGPMDAPAVFVTDNLPANVTFDHATPGCTNNGLEVVCAAGTLASGASVSYDIVVISPSAAGVITNTATVDGDVIDPVPANNTSSVNTTVEIEPTDLAVIKTADPSPVRFGEVMTYTLIVSNFGPGNATGVKVVDNLPSGITFVRATGCGRIGLKVTCNIGALAADQVVKFYIVVKAPSVEQTLTNTATVSGNEPDPVPDNNTSTITTDVIAPISDFFLPLVSKA